MFVLLWLTFNAKQILIDGRSRSISKMEIVENKNIFPIRSGPVCRVNSILELWSYNETTIRNLSATKILDMVNIDNRIR